MKRRNADTGKLRRPIKRTKITEGMYGNSMLYLKFIMVWALVVLADYMLEFRCEFLWPFWMMLRSVYDSYKYQGLAFSMFFMCIALTSDMICFFFIPIQYVFFAASTYVWGQYVWYTFADKGICLPTVAICCLIMYIEGLRGAWVSSSGYGRPLAAHCVGYPAVTLGVGVKKYVVRRLRQRTQRHVRAINEFYYALMRDAVPQSESVCECESSCASSRAMNGAANGKKRKPEQNGHCLTEQKPEQTEPPIDKKCSRERDKYAHNHTPAAGASSAASGSPGAQASHSHANGTATGPGTEDEEKPNHCKGSSKSMKYDKKEATVVKEEKREEKKRNKKDKEKEVSDSVKSTEHTKEQIVKDREVESTKDCVRNKESNNTRDKEKEKERERDRDKEREARERDREREKEREKELLSLQRTASECADELKRVKAELAAVQRAEAEARKALEAAGARNKQRRQDHAHLKQAHAALHLKVTALRTSERAALERRLSEERRARSRAEQQLLHARSTPSGECENSECLSRRAAAEGELAALRRELALARDAALALQRDCARANEQMCAAECRGSWRCGGAARATQLERALAAETRVKLDLLAALGDANRKMHIQDSVINRQEKQLEELKAQMLAVMPTEFVTPVTTVGSKLRLSDSSPLDPNATVYTPKQLCSDA